MSADFKMDVDEECDIIKCYLSLTEGVEQLESFIDGTKPKQYVTIQQYLIDCCQQIDLIITLETNHNSFLVLALIDFYNSYFNDILQALYQLKHQFIVLTNIFEKLIQEEQSVENNQPVINPLLARQFFFNNVQYENEHRQNEVRKSHKNSISESIILSSLEKPKVLGLNEIVGLHDIKKSLKSLVILPKTQPQLFYDRRVYNSILLYGPPGTGKTRLTHALAAEAKAAFHCVSAGDVLSHYVGQTEKKIKTLFQDLKNRSEFSILFIDEIDAFCRKRTQNEQEHTRRIKTEFMCQMSSIEDCNNLIVICATNCPWDLDSAILRRLQKRIYVPLPNPLERLEFFRFLTNNIHFEDALSDLPLLIQKTDGYSGSDLFDVVQAAMTIPLTELEDTKIWKCCGDGFYEPVLGEQDFSNVICSELGDLPANSVRARKVQLNDLLNAVHSVKSTVTQSDVKKFETFNG